LNFDLLAEVLGAYDQRKLWAAVGWLVSFHQEQWQPPGDFLDLCWHHRPRQIQYLVRNVRGGKALSRWNLILPPEVQLGFEGHATDP